MILQLAGVRTDRTALAGLALVLVLHLVAIMSLLSYAPAREALRTIAPLMVDLIKPEAPTVAVAAPRIEPKVDVAVKPPPVKKPVVQPHALPPTQPQPQITAVPAQSSATAETPAAPEARPAPDVAARTPTVPATAPVLPVAPAPAAAPVAIVPPSFNADYLDNPAPTYPASAKRMGEEGKVFLRVYVEASGIPSKVEVRTSSGSDRLDQAALEAVRRWKFVPAKQGDKPVPASVVVPITFSLKG